MRLGELIAGVDVRAVEWGDRAPISSARAELRVCDITEDSRTVLPGSLFVARRGEASDGRKFAAGAVAAGAIAVLTDDPGLELKLGAAGRCGGAQAPVLLVADDVPLATAKLAERFYGNPSSKLALIGVTGTNGKTTTTYLVHQILSAVGLRCGLMGTVVVDDGTEVAPASMTTPPAVEISRTLARMLEAGCRAAVLEVSSHSVVQQRIAGLSFDVGVFTNLSGDHLDYHGTMERYAAAKAAFLRMIPATGTVIVNADDPAAEEMTRGVRAAVLRAGLAPIGRAGAPGLDLVGRLGGGTRWETSMSIAGPWGSEPVRMPYPGAHNAMNALEAAGAAYALCRGCGKLAGTSPVGRLDAQTIARALEASQLPPGRLECLTSPADPVTVYIDYAHSDDALRTVLDVVREAIGMGTHGLEARATGVAGAITVVFGCGGHRDATKRPRMGAVAAELADWVVITSDNPRSEDPRAIIDVIASGIPLESHSRVTIEPDRERAIRLAVQRAAPGDAVLIAGKGHEDYQVLPAGGAGGGGPAPGDRASATVKRFFDDRLVAEDALRRRGITARSRPVTRLSHGGPVVTTMDPRGFKRAAQSAPAGA